MLVVGPPGLAERVRLVGYSFWLGAAPPERELSGLHARLRALSHEEAERVVLAELFATLNVRAMLPAMRSAVRQWRPDVILREPAEFSSAVVADEVGVPTVQVSISLTATETRLLSIAASAVDSWRAGLSERIEQAAHVTLFPAALEDWEVPAPPAVYRFRDPASDARQNPLPDWWGGDARPLVYVTFGSVTATEPAAAPIYALALEAVAQLPARVLVTTGTPPDEMQLTAPGDHVHIERWVAQADVLPHARLTVCHGGSGTTLGALAAGVPLVVTPLFADQPDNARRVAAVGAGVVVEPSDSGPFRSAVDPHQLRDAILAVMAGDTYTQAARAIAAEHRQLPPVDEALTLLDAAI